MYNLNERIHDIMLVIKKYIRVHVGGDAQLVRCNGDRFFIILYLKVTGLCVRLLGDNRQ